MGDRQTVWHGRAGITERLGPFEFDLGPTSFFQTNSRQAARLYDLVVESAGPQGDELALDLYCGTGTIGLYLAPHVAGVVGVESSQEAVDCARTNADRNGIRNARFVCGDVLAWLKAESGQASPAILVVIDPPRAGLHPDVPKRLAALNPRRIVYVSCNPAALARDAQLFADLGLVLSRVTPLDMFPQTAHMESVAVFETPRVEA
jgi:23S rRNA (uracil1939-C5)-methyltransferase